MNKNANPKLKENAQTLRKNMTPEERHLWYDFLKELPVNVNRQKVIGNYIVDFYIPSKKIVIELDGGQHFEDANVKKDVERDQYLLNLGVKVLRYTNTDIKKRFDDVCNHILSFLS